MAATVDYEGAFVNPAYEHSRYASTASIPGEYRKADDYDGDGSSTNSTKKQSTLQDVKITTIETLERNGTDLNGNVSMHLPRCKLNKK